MRGVLSNLHTHSFYSGDGGSPLEDYVIAAIEKGFVSLGFSEHAWNSYDGDCRIQLDKIPAYKAEIATLRERYAGEIELYTGIENDYYEPMPAEEFDYTIGSTHYLLDDTGYYHMFDYRHDMFEDAVRVIGGGSVRKLVEAYYDQAAKVALELRPDILGHIDLITKLNADGRHFDPKSDWYLAAAEKAVDAVGRTECIVEVNSGAISRNYTKHPYPGEDILRMLLARGIPVTVSSDAHNVAHLDFYFEEMRRLLLRIGFTHTKQLIGGAFVDIPL